MDQIRTLRRLLEERTKANDGKRPSNKFLAQYIKNHCEIQWLPSQKVLEYNLSLAQGLHDQTLNEMDNWTQVLCYLPPRFGLVWRLLSELCFGLALPRPPRVKVFEQRGLASV